MGSESIDLMLLIGNFARSIDSDPIDSLGAKTRPLEGREEKSETSYRNHQTFQAR
jgi:hypothetical protein